MATILHLGFILALCIFTINAENVEEIMKIFMEFQDNMQTTNRAILTQLTNLNARLEKIEDKYKEIDGSEGTWKKRLVLDGEFDIQGQLLLLTNKIAAIENTGVASTYVRWGATTCPANGTDLVYSGYTGGSHENQGGGAANFLCLSDAPQWNHFTNGHQNGADVFGAEYEHGGTYSSAEYAKYFGQDVSNEDVPCAVCRSQRSSLLMIPGRMDCLAGWTKEYDGYLSAGYSGHAAASEFVCLDKNPESLSGGHTNQNGKLFYLAEANCGSLKCPPYIDGRELTCVVCTK